MSKKIDHEGVSAAVIKEAPTETLEGALKFLTSLKELRTVKKLNDTYYNGILKAIEYNGENRAYYTFKFDGTVTGRLACSSYKVLKQSMGVSFHTLPRVDASGKRPNVRSLFIPDKRYFITADYSQMEVRVLAHLSKDANLIKAFYSGHDLHKYTASLIFNIDVGKVSKEQRQIAKTITFLILYGGGAWKLSREVGISEAAAKDIIENYFKVFPGVREWIDGVKKEVYTNKYVKNIFGRRRNLENIRSISKKMKAKAERQAGNFIVQSSASDILAFVVLDIALQLKAAGLDSSIKATVHDSIELESSREDLEDTIKIVRYTMLNYPKLKKLTNFSSLVPFGVEIECGRSFGEGVVIHFNDSGSVYNIEEMYESANETTSIT